MKISELYFCKELAKFIRLVEHSMQTENIQDRYKIVLAGNFGVGKTSALRRYIDPNSSLDTVSTVGTYSEYREVPDGARTVKFRFADTAGQERYRSMVMLEWKQANGAALFFSLIYRKSFQELEKWVDELKNAIRSTESPPIVIFGTKSDLIDQRCVFHDEALEFANKHGYSYFETSAKEQINIDEPLNYLINYIIDNKIEPFVDDGTNTSTESDSSNCFLS